jgi:mannose-6-phosphate isomerase-like protein (cupin superfamily)
MLRNPVRDMDISGFTGNPVLKRALRAYISDPFPCRISWWRSTIHAFFSFAIKTEYMEGGGIIIRRIAALPREVVLDGSRLVEYLHPERGPDPPAIGYSLAHAIVRAGEATLPHRLKSSSEVYVLLEGRGLLHVGDAQAEAGPGMAVYVPPGETQWIENTGDSDLEFLVIVEPYWRREDEESVA